MSKFTEISLKVQPIVNKIKNGINTDRNFEIVLKEFDPIINAIVRSMKHGSQISDDDLKQEASIMLWKCCNQYDETNTTLFYTYFYGSCINELSHYIYKNQSPLSVTEKEQNRTKPLRLFEKAFYNEHGIQPTLQEFVSVGFEKAAVERYLMLSYGAANGHIDIEELEELSSESSIEEDYENKEINSSILKAVNSLDPEISEIVRMKFYENKTYREISELTGVSVSKLKSRMQKAMTELKDLLVDEI